ncbi:TraB/GumN family protein [Candidatus Woesearchaeota archaeon]|nr:TraB/GumN family protein [Candidatus Woesearchaeota archaeon]
MSEKELFSKSPKQRRLPFVWQLDCEGVKSYLVGTSHHAPNCFKRDATNRLNGIEQLIVECVLPSVDEAGDGYDKMQQVSAPCESLICLLSDGEQETLAKIAHVHVSVLKELPSIGLVPYLLVANANPYFESVDQVFHDVADERGIPVNGLETVDEQIISIQNTASSQEDNILPLRKILLLNKKYHNLRAWLEKLGEAYVTGDTSKLREFICVDSLLQSEEKLILDRNQRLAERSIPYLTKPSLVAVGVGHCILEPSMQTLYEQRGIKVKQIE